MKCHTFVDMLQLILSMIVAVVKVNIQFRDFYTCSEPHNMEINLRGIFGANMAADRGIRYVGFSPPTRFCHTYTSRNDRVGD